MSKCLLPVENDFETKNMDDLIDQAHPFLMGKVSAVINELKPGKVIVDEIITWAVKQLNAGNILQTAKNKL
jgi:hypothetical protein